MRKFVIVSAFPAFMLAARFVPFDRLPSTCVFLRLTGYPCLTCGMTRSVMAVAHLHFHQSIHFNPLGLPFVATLAVWWLNSVLETLIHKPTPMGNWIRRKWAELAMLGLGILIVFGVTRIWLLAR